MITNIMNKKYKLKKIVKKSQNRIITIGSDWMSEKAILCLQSCYLKASFSQLSNLLYGFYDIKQAQNFHIQIQNPTITSKHDQVV